MVAATADVEEMAEMAEMADPVAMTEVEMEMEEVRAEMAEVRVDVAKLVVMALPVADWAAMAATAET